MTISYRKSAGRAKRFVSSFIAGLGAVASIWPQTSPVRYPHPSDFDALRRDGMRIGRDMRIVIDRERERVATKQK